MALSRKFAFNVSAAAKETAYDTAQTIDNKILVNLGTIPQENVEVIDDNDLTGGTEEATGQSVISRNVTYDVGISRGKPFALGFFGAYGLGAHAVRAADTGSAASAMKQHSCTPVDNDGGMNSFTFEGDKDGTTKKKYSGGLISTFSLSIARGANRMVSLDASILGSGTEVDAGSAQTEPSETQLNAATAGAFLSTTALASGEASAANRSQNLAPATSDLSGSPTNLTSTLRSMTWDYDNGIDVDSLYRVGGGNTLAVGERVGRAQTLTLDFDWANDTEIDRLVAQTEVSFQLLVQGPVSAEAGYYPGFNLIFPQLQYQTVEVVDDGGTLVNRVTMRVLDDAGGVHKSVYLDVFNTTATYMA